MTYLAGCVRRRLEIGALTPTPGVSVALAKRHNCRVRETELNITGKGVAEVPVGFITGVESTHPDKGTEMFLYELAVDEAYRRAGIGAALVRRLAQVAAERGCHGMWVGTEETNTAALRTYAAAGAVRGDDAVILQWSFDKNRPSRG